MARWIESWMPGSTQGPGQDPAGEYPGLRFGLPEDGIGSTVGILRRFGALTVDWFLGYAIAALFSGQDAIGNPAFSWTVLGVWFLLTAVPVALFGASAGMTAFGIRVASIDTRAVVGVPRALLRTALIALVVPALVRDADGRGWHDRATRTIVVRTRA